jgi:hypothetical protein
MRMQIRSRFLLLPIVLTVALVAGCSDSPVTPTTPDDTDMLKASVDGSSYDFGITTAFSQYDETAKRAEFGGTITGTSSRTLSASFVLDIDNATFPITLHDPSIGITYTTTAPGDTATYNCGILVNGCTMTITGKSGDRVSGTFSATLVKSTDTTKKIQITNGQFSALLKRT